MAGAGIIACAAVCARAGFTPGIGMVLAIASTMLNIAYLLRLRDEKRIAARAAAALEEADRKRTAENATAAAAAAAAAAPKQKKK
jgi:hypothetical protein